MRLPSDESAGGAASSWLLTLLGLGMNACMSQDLHQQAYSDSLGALIIRTNEAAQLGLCVREQGRSTARHQQSGLSSSSAPGAPRRRRRQVGASWRGRPPRWRACCRAARPPPCAAPAGSRAAPAATLSPAPAAAGAQSHPSEAATCRAPFSMHVTVAAPSLYSMQECCPLITAAARLIPLSKRWDRLHVSTHSCLLAGCV